MKTNTQCKFCKKEFNIAPSILKKGDGKYCSKECYTQSMFNGSNISCIVCHKVFYICKYNRDINKRKCCSKKCQGILLKTGKMINCIICDKEFYASCWDLKTGVKHCSHKCRAVTHSKKMKGRIPWIAGRKHSEETRKKMAPTWFKKGQTSNMKGKKHSEATMSKIAHTLFKKGHITWIKGKTHTITTRNKLREARMRQIMPTKDTIIELMIQNELDKLHIKYEKHFVIKSDGFAAQLDIAIPSIKFAIECDGDYWHSLPRKQVYDDQTNKYCNENGWTLIRFSENNIKKELNECIITVKRILDYLTTTDKFR